MEDFWYKFWMFMPVFLFSLTVHEVAHALSANWGGDLTATYKNRLTLNPIAHIDLFGTILIPILMLINPGLMLFGWAKPVPVDEVNFRDRMWNVVVAMAGPFSNVLLVFTGAFVFSFLLRVCIVGQEGGLWALPPQFYDTAVHFITNYIALNWVLCLFNLFPVPPLDGSHVIYHFFIRGHGHRYRGWDMYQRFGFFIFFGLFFLTPVGNMLSDAVGSLTMFTVFLIDFY